MNVVVLRGAVRHDPEVRTLPSGAEVLSFDLTVPVPDGPADHVPVAWTGGDPAGVVPGAEVLVTGVVRRRFFRVAGRTQSRTEVVARRVIPARRRARVRDALREQADALGGDGT